MPVRDEHAGRNGKCACGAVVHIPTTGTASEKVAVGKVFSEPAQAPVCDAKLQPAQRAAPGGKTLPTSPIGVAHAANRWSRREKLLLWGGTGVGLLLIFSLVLYLVVGGGKNPLPKEDRNREFGRDAFTVIIGVSKKDRNRSRAETGVIIEEIRQYP